MVSAKNATLLSAIMVSAAAANAGTVFYDDFDGGLTTGVTRNLASPAPITTAVVNTSPFADGNYLHAEAPSGSAQIWGPKNVDSYNMPGVSLWNKLAGATAITAPGGSYLNLNGGFDVFVRANSQDRGALIGTGPNYNTDRMYFRPVFVDRKSFNSGLRLAFTGLGNGAITLELQSNNANTFGTTAGSFTATNAPIGSAVVNSLFGTYDNTTPQGQTVHIGFTFSTDPSTGQVTERIWGINGLGDIDTTQTSGPALLSTQTFYVNANNVGTVAGVITPFGSTGSWYDVSVASNGALTNNISVDFDRYRIQDGTVTSFTGVPEPTSMAVLGLSAVLLGARRRKA